MPSSFAPLFFSALIATAPAPDLVVKCATELETQLQTTAAKPTGKMSPRAKARQALAVALDCPHKAGNGTLQLLKKNALGEYYVLEFIYANDRAEELHIDRAKGGQGFTRLFTLKRGKITAPAEQILFDKSIEAIQADKLRGCEGNEAARVAYAKSLDDNRLEIESRAKKPRAP